LSLLLSRPPTQEGAVYDGSLLTCEAQRPAFDIWVSRIQIATFITSLHHQPRLWAEAAINADVHVANSDNVEANLKMEIVNSF
jgi:hypothetical protein